MKGDWSDRRIPGPCYYDTQRDSDTIFGIADGRSFECEKDLFLLLMHQMTQNDHAA